jgi:hypothetical protein
VTNAAQDVVGKSYCYYCSEPDRPEVFTINHVRIDGKWIAMLCHERCIPKNWGWRKRFRKAPRP